MYKVKDHNLMALLSLKEKKNMFKNRKGEEGLTLVELLVVIALVGVVAAIALPIVTNVLSGARADADTASATNQAKFITDWTSAGANFTTSGGKIYAVVNGKTVAQISEGTGGAGGVAGSGVLATWDGATLSYTINPALCTLSSPDVSYYYNGSAGGSTHMGTNSSGNFSPSISGFPLGGNLGYGNTIANYYVAVNCNGAFTESDNTVS